VELVAVAARSLGARISPRLAARWTSRMGQALFRPPSVKGWDGGQAWIHAGAWIARHNALVELVRAGEGVTKEADLGRLLGLAEDEELSARAIERLLPD